MHGNIKLLIVKRHKGINILIYPFIILYATQYFLMI